MRPHKALFAHVGSSEPVLALFARGRVARAAASNGGPVAAAFPQFALVILANLLNMKRV